MTLSSFAWAMSCGCLFAVICRGADPLDSWTPRASGVGVTFGAVTYTAGQFTAVGAQGTVVQSVDGIKWLQPHGYGSDSFLYGVAYGNGIYVAAGDNGCIQTLKTGSNWSIRSSQTQNYLAWDCFGDGAFVAVGELGTIIMSTNGTQWSVAPLGSSVNLWSVGFGNGLFLAVGDNGTILTSDNASQWTASNSGTTNTLEGLAYGNGLYVVTGINGTILTSPDGNAWAAANSNVSDDLYGATFANGVFVVVGDNGVIVTSADGRSWTPRASGTSAQLAAVAYGNGQFVAVGTSGAIVQSDPIIGPTLSLSFAAPSAAQLSVTGWAGLTYQLEFSTNCQDWEALSSLTLSNTSGQFLDSFPTSAGQRFYRAVR
jgi:hypothetical protein